MWLNCESGDGAIPVRGGIPGWLRGRVTIAQSSGRRLPDELERARVFQ